MKKIYIKTTETCQLRCKHCYIGDNRDKAGFFNEDATIAWIKNYISKNHIKGEDILFSFHGGEPFLCDLDKMQKVCDAFPSSSFDATTNLMFPASKMTSIISFIEKNFRAPEDNIPFIKTSWDYRIRFQSNEQEKLFWNNVRSLLKNNIHVEVITCLTSELIHGVTPEDYLSLMDHNEVQFLNFERLTANTTQDKALIPDYQNAEEWLTECYTLWKERYKHIEIEFFNNMIYAAHGIFLDCRNRTCMRDVITINANGTYGGCPNTVICSPYGSIYGEEDRQKHEVLIRCEKSRHVQCFTCDLFKVCNGDCHQLAWQGNICPEPKKLLRRIIDGVEREKKIIIPDARQV